MLFFKKALKFYKLLDASLPDSNTHTQRLGTSQLQLQGSEGAEHKWAKLNIGPIKQPMAHSWVAES